MPEPLPDFGLTARSYLGGDLGASVRIAERFSLGISWSQLTLTPYANVNVDRIESTAKIQGGSLSALSIFIEPAQMLSRTTQVYLQAGAARYNASFPATILGTFERPPRLLSHKSTSIGGFLGGGLNVWFWADNFGLLGVRLDMKYHRMKGNDEASDRSIQLNGLRLGAGVTLSK